MFACIRQTARRLPRAASFSTTATAANASPKAFGGINGELEGILEAEAEKQPTGPAKLTKTNYPVYRVMTPGSALLPNALSYKASLNKQKMFKRLSVAPGPAISRRSDTFHQLNLDPRHFTRNSIVLSAFVTEMGKIKPRTNTGLTFKSQRLVGRTIRRAKMMGIIPTLSKGHKSY